MKEILEAAALFNEALLLAAGHVQSGWASYEEYEAVQNKADKAASILARIVENLPETEKESNNG